VKHFFRLALSIFCGFYSTLKAQQISKTPDFKLHKKGDYYVTWGYNREWFNKSDIHFTGPGYDFTLKDVKAVDRPSPINLDYVKWDTWSVPQFNLHVGYFISDKYSISVGWDHMKYVVDVPQTVKITGHIDPNISNPSISTNVPSGNYAGNYNNNDITLQPDFLTFEHTDGLNYASVDLERYDELWQSRKYKHVGVTLATGGGLGMIIPRSDVRFFGNGRNHFWNIAGWGSSLKAGLQFNIFKRVYLQTDFKIGYLELLNIHTTENTNVDKAQQHIIFYENYWVIGFRI